MMGQMMTIKMPLVGKAVLNVDILPVNSRKIVKSSKAPERFFEKQNQNTPIYLFLKSSVHSRNSLHIRSFVNLSDQSGMWINLKSWDLPFDTRLLF